MLNDIERRYKKNHEGLIESDRLTSVRLSDIMAALGMDSTYVFAGIKGGQLSTEAMITVDRQRKYVIIDWK